MATTRRRSAREGRALVQVGLACSLAPLIASLGCTTPSRNLSQSELLARRGDFQRAYAVDLNEMAKADEERIAREYREAVARPERTRQSHDILVLSGGGQFGAFGAGFLDGWGRVEDDEFVRPDFDVVSGISTGALIAPFAFIGTKEAYATVVDQYQNPGREWIQSRGLIPFLPGNISLLETSGFRSNVSALITPEIVSQVRNGGREARQLIVGATSLDYGELRVWDLARLATEKPSEEAQEEMSTLLAASSAIPGVFPPIEIDDLLYVDGAATMAIVGGLNDRRWLYSGTESSTTRLGSTPVRIRVWVIVNQKLLPDPALVKPGWATIMARSVDTVLRTSLLQTIQDAETFVQLLNGRSEFDARLYYVAIPQDFEVSDSDALFDEEMMRELVEVGREMGANPESWRDEALRPGAPQALP